MRTITLKDYEFTHVNNTTKKAADLVQGYKMATPYTMLSQVYGHYSNAKENAYNYCLTMCNDLDGYNFKIMGHNCNFFSVGFETEKAYIIITYANNYYVEK